MRRHSAWFAAGLLFFAVLACNLSRNANQNRNANGNSNNSSAGEVASGSAIKEIHMAKDNNGKPGDKSDRFEPGDHTIHCVTTLNEAKAGTEMRFSWWIVDAEGTKDQKIKDIDYTTRTLENVIHGHLTLPQDWPPGKYKVQVYVNGNLDKTLPYTVE